MYFLSVVLINSCFPSESCTLVETRKANGGPLTAIREPCKCVKNCKEEKEAKWKEIHG